MSVATYLVVIPAIAALSIGCHSGASSPGSPVDDAGNVVDTDPRAFWKRLANATCDKLWSCPFPDDDQLRLKVLMGTPERCAQLEPKIFLEDAWVRTLLEAVIQGTIHYWPERESACLDAIGVCGVGAQFADLQACREVFDGNVQTGGSCSRDEECEGEAFCGSVAGGFDPVCPGQCMPRRAPGESCHDAAQCASTRGAARCESTDGGIVSAVCHDYGVEYVEVGQPCGSVDPETLKACGPGLWCRTDPQTMVKSCSEAIAVNQPCGTDNEVCVERALCLPSSQPGDGNACQQVSVRNGVGDACGGLNPCDLFGSLACVAGACQLIGDGTEGSACLLGFYASLGCRGDLACLPPAVANATGRGQCGQLVSAGGACTTSLACASGQCNVDSTCAATQCLSHL